VANSAVLDYETTPTFVLTVQASDGTLTDTADITVNLNNLPDNASPVADDVSANGSEDDASIAITLTGTDADGTIASFRLIGLPANGGLYTDAGLTSAAAAGVDYAAAGNALTLYFAPVADWNGATTFQFSATDNSGAADATPATATINVAPVNDPPTATNLSTAETYTEDTALNLVDIVVSDVDGGNVTVILTLSDAAAGTLNTATAGSVTSTFAGGVWTASGPLADVNALLAALTFTPAANYNSNFTIATNVSDGVAPALAGTKVMTGTPVNDAPVLGNNSFAVNNGGALLLTSANLSATDVDDPAANLVFTVSGVTNGQFLVGGVPALTFTQLQLTSGQVQFVHDGSGVAPTFMLEVSDPAAAVDGPYLGNIVFNGGGGGGPGGGAGSAGAAGSGVGGLLVLPPPPAPPLTPLAVRPDVLPSPVFPLVDPASQEFLRPPAKPAKETRDDVDTDPVSKSTSPTDAPAAPERRPASVEAPLQALDARPELAPIRPEADSLGVLRAGSDASAAGVRAHVAAVPARHAAAVEAEAREGAGPVADGLRFTAVVPTLGAVASVALAAGLIAKLLAASVGPRLRALAGGKQETARRAPSRRLGRRRLAKRQGVAPGKSKR
jgi:hypothetical protein